MADKPVGVVVIIETEEICEQCRYQRELWNGAGKCDLVNVIFLRVPCGAFAWLYLRLVSSYMWPGWVIFCRVFGVWYKDSTGLLSQGSALHKHFQFLDLK